MSDPEKQGMGCFAKGCLTVIVVCLLLTGMVIGGGYYYLKRFVNNLTSDKPVAIKVEQPTDAQMQAAAAKAQALSDAFNNGKEVTVELTGSDINALIAWGKKKFGGPVVVLDGPRPREPGPGPKPGGPKP